MAAKSATNVSRLGTSHPEAWIRPRRIDWKDDDAAAEAKESGLE